MATELYKFFYKAAWSIPKRCHFQFTAFKASYKRKITTKKSVKELTQGLLPNNN